MADAWGGSWGRSWGGSWGGVAVPAALDITDTDILQMPVNAVLIGQQTVRDRYREYDLRPPAFRTRRAVSATPAKRLRGGPPSFTVRTDNKGYE